MDSKKKNETVLIIRQSRGFIVLSSPNLSSSNVEILWKRNNWSINQSQFQTDAVERPILIKNAHAVRSQRSQIRSSHLLILLEIQINTTLPIKQPRISKLEHFRVEGTDTINTITTLSSTIIL